MIKERYPFWFFIVLLLVVLYFFFNIFRPFLLITDIHLGDHTCHHVIPGSQKNSEMDKR